MPNADVPIPYRIRRHGRAKYIRLTVSRKGVQVTLPSHCHDAEAEKMVRDKHQWIEQQLQKFSSPSPVNTPINQLFLRAINQPWSVHYVADSKRCRLLMHADQRLVIFGAIDDNEKCQQLLLQWLRQQAKKILIPWITELSLETDLAINHVSIRAQQTRWGSCSSDKNISLNYKLIFLPEKLVEHILLHELCHTQHMDHSEAFWNLLRKLDKHCDLMNQQSRHAGRYVPEWLE